MNNEELKLLLKGILVTICYLGYVVIFLKILINKINTYKGKPELLIVVAYAPLIGMFTGFALLGVLDTVFTKIIGG